MEVISREVIKPSSPEIDHVKKLKLSYLDEITPRVYVPIVFFYEADESKGLLTSSKHVQISKQLKQSLSAALSSFYPLAGRVEAEGDDVDCNDAGVEFIEARVHAQLADVLKGPYREDYKLEQYYYLPVGRTSCEMPFLFVQVTLFDCGGIALGLCYSHLFTDCHSIMIFINAWASACRSEEKSIPQMVSFDLANYFPAWKIPPMDIATGTSNNKLLRTKLFVFDKEKIALLKKKSATVTADPSSVQVISAFIWKFMLDIKCTTKTKTVAALHAVNLRGRKTLLKNVFGNSIMLSLAYANVGVDVEFDALVANLKRSFKQFDDDYITESQNGDTYLNDLNSRIRMCSGLFSQGEMEVCVFSAWSRFPFYQLDYGFGTPILFCPAMGLNNGCVLVSSKTGESIEAWVTMEEEHNLQMLENQINLISTTPL